MVRFSRMAMLGCGVAVLLTGGAGAARAQGAVVPGNVIQQKIGLTPDAINARTRGIRPASPQGTPAPAPAPAPQEMAIDLTVRFALGSAELTGQAIAQLDELGAALKSAPASYHFRIEGHTDTTGTPEGNKVLSQRRADAVVSYLTSKFGIAAGQLQAIGRGQEHLLVRTADQVDEPANRRVTVVNLGG